MSSEGPASITAKASTRAEVQLVSCAGDWFWRRFPGGKRQPDGAHCITVTVLLLKGGRREPLSAGSSIPRCDATEETLLAGVVLRELISVYMNPRFVEENLDRVGKTVSRLPEGTPNQEARVAAYCDEAMVGTQRPLTSESLGPPSTRVG